MKKILLLITLFGLILPVFSDTKPCYMDSIPLGTIGLYQTGDDITIYSEPDENSEIIKQESFSYKNETMSEKMFALLINDRQLGFLYVSDIGDDNWAEVIYDRTTGERGWVRTEDVFQFLPWLSFYNTYGRKYGLLLLKDVPDEIKVLHSKSEDLSQNVADLKYVTTIRVTAIRGNWALVSVFDIDRTPKTGYLRWRSDNGEIYAFPDIK